HPLNAIIFAIVALIGWRIGRRFGMRGEAIWVSTVAIINPPGDYFAASYVNLGMAGRDSRSRFETDITDQHWKPFVRMKALVQGIQFETADHDEPLISSLVEPLECGFLLTECRVKRCQSPSGHGWTVGFSRLLPSL